MEVQIGTVIAGEFVVVRRRASREASVVYDAERRSTGEACALKLMLPAVVATPDQRARFATEVRAGSGLDSEHVVKVLAAGVDTELGCPYIAMELLEGESLAAMLSRRGALPRTEAVELLSQLFRVVGEAHAKDLVHRRLKPTNILLTVRREKGAPPTVKVLDFGVGQLLDDAHATGALPLGSPMWLAPEQTAPGALAGPYTDVWALGLIAFNMLTGLPYWRATTGDAEAMSELLDEVLSYPLLTASLRATELGVVVPIPFDRWFAACVTREPAMRFLNASEALAALLDAIAPDSRRSAATINPPPMPSTAATGSIPPTGTWSQPPRGVYAAVAPKVNGASVPPAAGSAKPGATPRATSMWVALGAAALLSVTAIAVAVASKGPKEAAHKAPDDDTTERKAASAHVDPLAIIGSPDWVTDPKPDPRQKTHLLTVTPPPKLVDTFRTVSARVESPRLQALFGGFALGGSGSGFVLVRRHEPDPWVFVITNRHVISESESVEVALEDGTKVSGEVLYADRRHDVAVVGFAGKKPLVSTGLTLATGPVSDLDSVVATGYPFLAGKPSFQISKGEVRNKAFERNFDEDVKETYIQHSASIDPGSSGGPLLNANNEVVGINTGFLPEKHDVFLALPASDIDQAVTHAIEIQAMRNNADWRRAGITKACKELAGELSSDKPRFRVFLQFISNRFVASDGFASFLAESQDFSVGSGLANVFESDPMDAMRDALLIRVYGGVQAEGGVLPNPCGDINPTDAADLVNTPVVRMSLNLKNRTSEIGWTFEQGQWRVATAPLSAAGGAPTRRGYR